MPSCGIFLTKVKLDKEEGGGGGGEEEGGGGGGGGGGEGEEEDTCYTNDVLLKMLSRT
jgi:hypothetical protein